MITGGRRSQNGRIRLAVGAGVLVLAVLAGAVLALVVRQAAHGLGSTASRFARCTRTPVVARQLTDALARAGWHVIATDYQCSGDPTHVLVVDAAMVLIERAAPAADLASVRSAALADVTRAGWAHPGGEGATVTDPDLWPHESDVLHRDGWTVQLHTRSHAPAVVAVRIRRDVTKKLGEKVTEPGLPELALADPDRVRRVPDVAPAASDPRAATWRWSRAEYDVGPYEADLDQLGWTVVHRTDGRTFHLSIRLDPSHAPGTRARTLVPHVPDPGPSGIVQQVTAGWGPYEITVTAVGSDSLVRDEDLDAPPPGTSAAGSPTSSVWVTPADRVPVSDAVDLLGTLDLTATAPAV